MNLYKFKIKFDNKREQDQGSGFLLFEEENMHPPALKYKQGKSQLIILGSPVHRDKIDNMLVSREILKKGMDKSFITGLDGSFLIILHNGEEGTVNIVNDRFASIPFYYYFDGKGFIGSINYIEIWSELRKAGNPDLNKEAFYEFIHLQRLLGNKTYDRKSRYLDSATIVSVDTKRNIMKTEKYWQPAFTKKDSSAAELSRTLAELTKGSILRRMSDGKKYGLLLSGGLDSRLVLAGLEVPAECITVCERENNEYIVAKDLADQKGYPHSFIKRPDTHYADILEEAVFLGSAMNTYDHAHFLNLGDKLKAKADVFLHGHGFDYMFQGKYLPADKFKLFGKSTYIKRLKNINKDITDEFLSGISYRLKSVDPMSLVIDKEKDSIRDYIYSSVDEVLKEGRPFCNGAYDFWEYLIMHNLSRHYTFLNIASIRTFAEERTVAFDNQLFDFYLSLPAKDRLNRNIFTDAIKLLNNRLHAVRNANTNCNIYDSDIMLTAKLLSSKALNRIGFKTLTPPKQEERSWPVRADIIRKNSKIRKIAEGLADSWALDMLGFLNMDKVKFYTERHLEGKIDHSDLILTLITIDAFLKKGQRGASA